MEECWRMARIRKTGKRSICKGEGQDRWSTLCFDWIKNNNSRSTSGGGWFGYPPTWRPCHTHRKDSLWVALWNRIRHPQSIVTGDKDTRHISKYFAMAGPKQRELIFFIRPGTLSICGGLAVPLNESESCVPDPCVLWTPMFLNSPSSMFFLVTSWAYRINIYASAYIGYVGMD